MSKPQQLSEKYTKEIFQEIKSGIYSRADRLPSEPDIAKHFGISRTMVRDCLSTLEREGFIETVAGKGSFVAARNMEFIREEQLRQAEEALQKAVDLARTVDISLEELTEILAMLYKGESL